MPRRHFLYCGRVGFRAKIDALAFVRLPGLTIPGKKCYAHRHLATDPMASPTDSLASLYLGSTMAERECKEAPNDGKRGSLVC